MILQKHNKLTTQNWLQFLDSSINSGDYLCKQTNKKIKKPTKERMSNEVIFNSMSEAGPLLCTDITYQAVIGDFSVIDYLKIRMAAIVRRGRCSLQEFMTDKAFQKERAVLAKGRCCYFPVHHYNVFLAELKSKMIVLTHLKGNRQKKITTIAKETPK
jgi:hypothetical protein